jgi:hypothetical protein
MQAATISRRRWSRQKQCAAKRAPDGGESSALLHHKNHQRPSYARGDGTKRGGAVIDRSLRRNSICRAHRLGDGPAP